MPIKYKNLNTPIDSTHSPKYNFTYSNGQVYVALKDSDDWRVVNNPPEQLVTDLKRLKGDIITRSQEIEQQRFRRDVAKLRRAIHEGMPEVKEIINNNDIFPSETKPSPRILLFNELKKIANDRLERWSKSTGYPIQGIVTDPNGIAIHYVPYQEVQKKQNGGTVGTGLITTPVAGKMLYNFYNKYSGSSTSPSIAEAVQVGIDVLNQRRRQRENLDKLNKMGSETPRKVSKLVTEQLKKIAKKQQKEATSAKKATTESLPQSLPESWGNITLDQAKAELQDYYNQVGEQKDVSKMSNEDFINEFNNYLEYQNSKLNDQYYQTKPLVIQQQEQPRQEQPKYANVDLSRKEVRDILNLYGYNPYRDFTASQRRAIRKRAAGNKDLDMEWLRNFDHTLNGESLYDFFVTYRKRGGKLISNNIVERFKNRYKL